MVRRDKRRKVVGRKKRRNSDVEEIDQDELDRREEELHKISKNNGIERVSSLDDFIIRDDEDYDRNTYFEVDTEPLRNELTSALAEKLDLDPNKISSVIHEVFSNSSEKHCVDEYFDTKPTTNVNLPTKQKEEFLNIRRELEEETPTVEKIMNSNITRGDKKICLRLFDQFNNTEAYSDVYFRLIDSINEILSKAKVYTKQEVAFLEAEEEKLKTIYVSKDTLKTKILKLEADTNIKARLLSMYDEMMSYPNDSTTHTSLREEIEWSIRLPYQKREVDSYVSMNNLELNRFYCEVRSQLDDELYGMEKVKERIIHVLNDRRSSGDACGRNIALVGAAGTGKTQICKVLAKILNKKFAKISAGALDSAAIKGTNRVWIGAEPSIVLQILGNLKTNNAIIAFDEVDKLGETPQGKLAQHALLHVSDPADNKDFQDNYLKNFSHDLSKVLFIYIMNTADCLDEALKDRFDIIEVDQYTNDEKLQIFKNYMLPKALINLGMNKRDVVVNDSAIKKLLEERNIGLRSIEKIIKDLIGKVNMYRNVLLSNGTIGDLELPYSIPNFKLPLKIDYTLLKSLID